MNHRRKSGFSLLEVLIVLSILGTLVAGIYAVYDTSVHSARVNSMRAKRRAVKEAIEQYYARYDTYPPSLEALTKTYLSRIPDDPMTNFYGNDWLVHGPISTESWISSLSTSIPAGGVYDIRSASGLF